jgi:site-specific DNA recombinase
MRLLQSARLSRLGDASTGLDKQDAAAERYAFINGDTIVAKAEDTNVSGSTDPFTRPDLGPWLTKPALMAQYDGIIAAMLDRLGRSARYLSKLREWADDNGKTIIVINPPLRWPVEPNDIGSKIMWSLLSVLAEIELDTITLRSAETRAKLLADECLVGRVAYGYQIIPKPGSVHKIMSPDPFESVIVMEMFKRYLDGWTLQQIADDLMGRRIAAPTWKGKPGKTWYVHTIGDILRNPAAIGRRIYGGKTVLRFEAIVSVTDFNAVQKRLDSRAHRQGVPPQGAAMLTSSLFCPCGKPMYRIGSGGGTKKIRSGDVVVREQKNGPRKFSYYCRSGKGGCKNMLPVPELDSRVSEAIVSMYGDLPHRLIGVVPGYDYADELAQLKMDMDCLDPLDDAFLDKATAIRAEMIRVSQLEAVGPKVEIVSDGRTVAQVWSGLDEDGKRQWLIDHGWRVEASRDEAGEIILGISGGELDADALALTQLAA